LGQRGIKVAALVAGMVAGADSIDDMTCCAPAGWVGWSAGSTLGLAVWTKSATACAGEAAGSQPPCGPAGAAVLTLSQQQPR